MKKDTITIRRWTVEDWASLKAARLMAVKDCPTVFLSNYETTAAMDDAYWKKFLTDPRQSAVFGLYDADAIIGLSGIFRDRKSPNDKANLGMTFIAADYRGRGLSDLFFKERLAWAKAQGDIRTISVAHREGNAVSRANILKWGFAFLKTEQKPYGDGVMGTSYYYELKI